MEMVSAGRPHLLEISKWFVLLSPAKVEPDWNPYTARLGQDLALQNLQHSKPSTLGMGGHELIYCFAGRGFR